MELSEVRDRVEIATLFDDFAFGIDRLYGVSLELDPAAGAAVFDLFTRDGILHTPFLRAEGREAIREVWSGGVTRTADRLPKYARHHLTSREINFVDSTTAHTTVYTQCLTERGLDHWGYNEARIVKLADGWKIAENLVTVQDWVADGYYASLPNPKNPVRTW